MAEASARASEAASRGRLPLAERPVTVLLTWAAEPARRTSTTFTSGSCGYEPDGRWRARSDGTFTADVDDSGIAWDHLDVVTDDPTSTDLGRSAAARLTADGWASTGATAPSPGQSSVAGTLQLLDAQGRSATFTAPAEREVAGVTERAPLAGVTVQVTCGPSPDDAG